MRLRLLQWMHVCMYVCMYVALSVSLCVMWWTWRMKAHHVHCNPNWEVEWVKRCLVLHNSSIPVNIVRVYTAYRHMPKWHSTHCTVWGTLYVLYCTTSYSTHCTVWGMYVCTVLCYFIQYTLYCVRYVCAVHKVWVLSHTTVVKIGKWCDTQ